MIHAARRQYSASADKIAARIVNCAQAVRQDLALGRPAGPAARQLAADATALLEALAELRAVEKLAAWTRQPAARTGGGLPRHLPNWPRCRACVWWRPPGRWPPGTATTPTGCCPRLASAPTTARP